MIDLRLGDCLELMKDIESGSIDAIITDPPYGTTACKWDSVIPFDLMWEQLNRIIKPNGAIVLFGSEPFSSALRMSNISHFKYSLIWEKSSPTNPMQAKRRFLNVTEDINVFYKKQCTYNPQGIIEINKIRGSGNGALTDTRRSKGMYIQTHTNYPRNILKYSRDNQNIHPTQKPVALMEYLIKTYTNENETVLDFTAGSFTTAIACMNTKRDFIGIEKDETYFNIGVERVEKHKLKLNEDLFYIR